MTQDVAAQCAGPPPAAVAPTDATRPPAVPVLSAVDSAVVARNAKSTAAAQAVNQGVRFLTSIVMARLLTPHDFGIVALALVMSTFIDEIKDVGMGATIVQRRTVDHLLLSSVFYANVVIGAIASAALFLVSGPMCRLLGDAEATPAAQGFAAILFITSLGQIHLSLLRRTMQFRAIAVVTCVTGLVTAVVSIGCAVAGMTFWALVIGNGAGAVTGTLMYWHYDTWRPTRNASLTALRSVWGTSWNIFMVGFLTLIWVQLDKLIVSKFVGGVGLGLYTMGQRVVNTPLNAISGVLSDVNYSAFSRRQDDNAALQRGFIRASSAIALVTFPLMFGTAAVAAPLVPVVFGSQWDGLVPAIWLLAPAGAFASVTFNADQILRAKQRSDWSWRWGVVHLVVLGAAEYYCSRWGMVGVAAGYAVGTLVLMPFTLMLVFRSIEGRARSYARALTPYVAMATAMAAAVLGLTRLLDRAGASHLLQSVTGIACGMLVYGALVLLFRPAAFDDVLANVWKGRRHSHVRGAR